KDPKFGGSDLDVEVEKKVHPEESIDATVTEVEHVDGKPEHREAENSQLGDMEDVPFLLGDRSVHLGPLECVPRAVANCVCELRDHRRHGGTGIEHEAAADKSARPDNLRFDDDQITV